jgi:hypothetical protein
MIGNLPDVCWDTVAVKKFEEDKSHCDITDLSGDEAEIYRITVRHNNAADERDQIRFNVNGDYQTNHYEAVEAYMSADYTFGDRKIFTALSDIIPGFDDLWESGRAKVPDWRGFDLVHPGWRVLRNDSLGYLSFGKPNTGINALFGQGILLSTTGGPRSLIRMCAEQHPNGNLLTIGRYTYKQTEEEITELNFSSGHDGGIGQGSFIVIEKLDLPPNDEL